MIPIFYPTNGKKKHFEEVRLLVGEDVVLLFSFFSFLLHHPAMQSTLGVLQGYLVIHEIPLTERWQSKHRVMGLCFRSFFPLGDRKENMITSHDGVRWRRFLKDCFPHGNQLHAFSWQ